MSDTLKAQALAKKKNHILQPFMNLCFFKHHPPYAVNKLPTSQARLTTPCSITVLEQQVLKNLTINKNK